MEFFTKILNLINPKSKKKSLSTTPRAPRLHADILEQVEFILNTKSGDLNLSVQNLSTNGIALQQPQGMLITENNLQGIIRIKDQSFSVELTVIHRNDKFLGCKFSKVPENFHRAFDIFFKYQLLASSFSQVNSALLNQPSEGLAHWYFDRNENEVYFVNKDSSILHFHIVIDGNYIEGGQGQALRTGTTSEDKSDYGVKSSKIVKFDSDANIEVLDKGLSLLRYLRFFCEGDFDTLIESIKNRR